MTLSRIRHLLALATNPTTPVEEARTAAMLACKAIAEQKLLDGGVPKEKTEAPRRPGVSPSDLDPFWSAVEDMMRAAGRPPEPRGPRGPSADEARRTDEGVSRMAAEDLKRRAAERERAEERARAEEQARTAADPKSSARRAYAEGYDRILWPNDADWGPRKW